MDIKVMVKHYKDIFNEDKFVLLWIEHDLKHMGIDKDQVDSYILEAKKILGKAQ